MKWWLRMYQNHQLKNKWFIQNSWAARKLRLDVCFPFRKLCETVMTMRAVISTTYKQLTQSQALSDGGAIVTPITRWESWSIQLSFPQFHRLHNATPSPPTPLKRCPFLIPGIWDYVPLSDKRDFADVIIKDLEMKRLFQISQVGQI